MKATAVIYGEEVDIAGAEAILVDATPLYSRWRAWKIGGVIITFLDGTQRVFENNDPALGQVTIHP